MRPETNYARSGDLHIAYQVLGEGPVELVVVPRWVSNIDHWWDHPRPARFLERLAEFSRLILLDGRGTGLSDPVHAVPTLEERVDDVLSVMEAVGSERAALFGQGDAAAVSALAAATYPERVQALVLYGGYASSLWHPDYPWAPRPEERAAQVEQIVATWGTDQSLPLVAPSGVGDSSFRDWFVRMGKLATSPGRLRDLLEMNASTDVRHILPTIRVPTLVLHRKGDRAVPVDNGRYLAEKIPGAKYVELDGIDHFPFAGDFDSLLDEVREFVTGTRWSPAPERVLATLLFTDIVGSTQRAVELGDRRWREVLDAHDEMVRRQLDRFRGTEVKATGDGFLATFDGPARAIHCARAISLGARQLGIDIRAGLHTGECEMRGRDVGGVAVHVAARVLAHAAPGEVLVSSTVRDLVAGSGIEFTDRGTYELKGLPDKWRLLSVAL